MFLIRRARARIHRRSPWRIDQGVLDCPGDLSIPFERRDPDRHGVLAEGNIVQHFAIHVHEEGVPLLGHWSTLEAHQHARSIDLDVPVGIAQEREDRARSNRDGSLYFNTLPTHPHIVSLGFVPTLLRLPLHLSDAGFWWRIGYVGPPTRHRKQGSFRYMVVNLLEELS